MYMKLKRDVIQEIAVKSNFITINKKKIPLYTFWLLYIKK